MGRKEVNPTRYMILKTIYMLCKTLIDLPENLYRSYRLGDEDIKAMSKKGYTVFDADKGRFVRPSAEFLKQLQKRREVSQSA